MELLDQILITDELLKPILQGIISNVKMVLPWGIGIFAIWMGVWVIPRIVKYLVGHRG